MLTVEAIKAGHHASIAYVNLAHHNLLWQHGAAATQVQENSYWHDIATAGFCSRTIAIVSRLATPLCPNGSAREECLPMLLHGNLSLGPCLFVGRACALPCRIWQHLCRVTKMPIIPPSAWPRTDARLLLNMRRAQGGNSWLLSVTAGLVCASRHKYLF